MKPDSEFGRWFCRDWPGYSLELAPRLREELIFALIDIRGAIERIQSDRRLMLPIMLERDRDRLQTSSRFPPTPEKQGISKVFGSVVIWT
jgi:hypothetical protein